MESIAKREVFTLEIKLGTNQLMTAYFFRFGLINAIRTDAIKLMFLLQRDDQMPVEGGDNIKPSHS